jgi:flagellar biogenesis protein FliO
VKPLAFMVLLILPVVLVLAQPLGGSGEATALEPAIPFKTGSALDSGTLLRIGGVLVLCLGLALIAALLIRRYTGVGVAAAGGRLRLLESRRLSPRLTLFLVEVDGSTHLLAQSGDSVVLLPGHREGAADDAD